MRVYHLLSFKHALSNIREKRLKVARIDDLNDPFELLAGQLKYKCDRKSLAEWKRVYQSVYGFLCFAKSWRNPVLWSHYADRHKGICLGFDIINTDAKEVEYTNQRIPVRYKGSDQRNGLDSTFANRLLRTKFVHWRYEDEVRVFVPLDPGHTEAGLFFRPFSSALVLREVVLGPLCPHGVLEMHDLVAAMRPRVRVLRARLAFRSFSVVVDRRVGQVDRIVPKL